MSRALALLVAGSALFGLAVQFWATYSAHPSIAASVWILSRYFTIVANILVATVFAGLAARRSWFEAPALQGGIFLTILLVAIVYRVLLAGTLQQTDTERLADLFLHSVTPTLVLVHWVLYGPRGGLRWRDPLFWAVIPVLYLVYALARGAAQVATNAGLIAVGFLGAGLALVRFDRWVGGRSIR